MNRHRSTRFAVGATALLVAVFGATTRARAQAWTPPQGEGAVTMAYQHSFVKYHLFTTTPLDRGHIRSHALLVDVSYGITDKLAVSIGVPYIGAKYDGPYPHPTGIDNGRYHSTFQDLRFDVRYNLAKKGLVVTPFAGTLVPSHDYQYWAHSAVGRNVREFQIGVYGAKLLDSVLPGLFVTGHYSYAFAQRIVDVSHNRSNVGLELGYFVKPELRVFALGAGQLTHGGVDFPDPRTGALPPILQVHHDQIGRDNGFNLGAGVAYNITPSFDIVGSVIHTVVGRNMHEQQYGVTVGASWIFTTRRATPHASRSKPTARSGAETKTRRLARCICQKGH